MLSQGWWPGTKGARRVFTPSDDSVDHSHRAPATPGVATAIDRRCGDSVVGVRQG